MAGKSWEELLKSLHRHSHFWKQLVAGTRDEWEEFDPENGKKIHDSLGAMRLMRLSQCYILFLAVMRNFENLPGSPLRLFEAIEKFSYVYHLISAQPANQVERLYAKTAETLEEALQIESEKKRLNKVDSVLDSAIQRLRDMLPSESQFKEDFRSFGYKQSEKQRRLIYYTLEKLNAQFDTGEISLNYDDVNIEHLLPQNPPEENGVEYVDLIGNLTLIHKKMNSRMGNKSVEEKLPILGESQIKITQMLSDQVKQRQVWDDGAILNRQDFIADTLYKNILNF